MNDNKDSKRDKVIVFLLLTLLIIGILCIFAAFCGAIMHFLGFQYESVGQFFLFFVFAMIVSYPMNLIAEALPKALLNLGKISIKLAVLLYIPLDTFATFFGFYLVDLFMPSVSATSLSLIVTAFTLALLSVYLEKSDKRKHNEKE